MTKPPKSPATAAYATVTLPNAATPRQARPQRRDNGPKRSNLAATTPGRSHTPNQTPAVPAGNNHATEAHGNRGVRHRHTPERRKATTTSRRRAETQQLGRDHTKAGALQHPVMSSHDAHRPTNNPPSKPATLNHPEQRHKKNQEIARKRDHKRTEQRGSYRRSEEKNRATRSSRAHAAALIPTMASATGEPNPVQGGSRPE